MAVTTQSVIDRIVEVANDPLHKQLRMADIARWLNEAQVLIANSSARPAGQHRTLTLAAGVRQDLRTIDPAVSWIRLHDVLCNVVADSPTGDTIYRVDRTALDAAVRAWRSTVAGTVVLEFSQDERDPFTFDVYPPLQAGVKVYAYCSVKPAPVCVLNPGQTALLDTNETIKLPDGYDIPMVDYVLARYFLRQTEVPSAAARAKVHSDLFTAAAGLITQAAKGA